MCTPFQTMHDARTRFPHQNIVYVQSILVAAINRRRPLPPHPLPSIALLSTPPRSIFQFSLNLFDFIQNGPRELPILHASGYGQLRLFLLQHD